MRVFEWWKDRLTVLVLATLVLGACSPGTEQDESDVIDQPEPIVSDEGGGDVQGENGSDDPSSEAGPSGDVDPEALEEVTGGWPTEIYNGEAGATKKLLLGVLKSGEPLGEEFRAALTEDFLGQDFTAVETVPVADHGGVAVAEWQPVEPSLDADAFVSAFESYRSEFGQVVDTEIHTWELQLADPPPGPGLIGLEAKESLWLVGEMPDGSRREDRMLFVFDLVRPEDQTGEEISWQIAGIRAEDARTSTNEGQRFVDVTAAALPPGYDQYGAEIYSDGGPTLGDVDGDGDTDLFLPRMHAQPKLYLNDGLGQFEDATTEWGLVGAELQTGSNSGIFFDYDLDGNQDLVVGFQSAGLRLYHNEGGFFRDVTGSLPLAGPGYWESIAVADADGDGLPDIYATNYGLINSEVQPESYVDARDGGRNVLLRNAGGGLFDDVTAESGLEKGYDSWSYAAAWADYDVDGDMDLYVANDYGPNTLFENDGSGQFTDVTDSMGAQDYGNGMGVSWLDFDNDLDLDLYVSNMQSFAGNRITRLKNFPGTEEDRAMYRRFSQGSSLMRNDGDDGFQEWSDEAGLKAAFWAWGNTAFDYDNDSDLDVFGSAGFYTGPDSADT